MKLAHKIFATFFFAQAAFGTVGINQQYPMQQQQGARPQMAQQSSMPAPWWMQKGPQAQMPPMQWPMMMSKPMQQFGQAPQVAPKIGPQAGPYQAPPQQMMGPGMMGQQQSLNIPTAVPSSGMGTGMMTSPQIQNQPRTPAGGANKMMLPGPRAPRQAPQRQHPVGARR